MYHCKCGKPVERSIEGKIVCQDCWDRSQMSLEDIKASEELDEYQLDEQEWEDFKQQYYPHKLSEAPMCAYCGKKAKYDPRVDVYFCCETVIDPK